MLLCIFALLWATLATHWVPSVHNSSYWPLVKLCIVSVLVISNIFEAGSRLEAEQIEQIYNCKRKEQAASAG